MNEVCCSRCHTVQKGVTYNPDRSVASCVFCDIVANVGRITRVWYQDDELIVFTPTRPAAQGHLLVVPTKHIKTAKQLTPDDLGLLRRMHEVGQRILTAEFGAGPQEYSFHMPPFNSIDHLHLHCFLLPFKNTKWRRVYNRNYCYCKSYETILARLEAQARARL